MQEGWKTYKLGNVAEICSSKRIFRSDYTDEGVVFYRSKEIIEKANGITNNAERLYISVDRFAEIKKKYGVPVEGDLLISAVGNRSGIPYVVKEEEEFYFKDGNLIWFKNISNQLNTTFLYYWIRSGIGQSTLQSIMIGSAQKALTISGFRNLDVLLPPLQEQKAIASILSALDDKIELNLQMNKTLEEMAMALYKHWFVDFGPFQDGEFVDSELGKIPKGWEVKKVGDVVKIVGGYAFKGKDFSEKGEKVIKIKNISNNVVSIEGANCIPKTVFEKSNRKFIVIPGSYLVAMTGAEVGKVGLVPDYKERLWLNQRVGMVSNPSFDNADILVGSYLQGKECYEIIQNLAYGSAQPNISSSGLESIEMIIPQDAKIIEPFLLQLKSWHEMKVENYSENQTLKNLRDTMLPKLISGEVRVKDIEQTIANTL